MSGVDLLTVLLSPVADGTVEAAPAWELRLDLERVKEMKNRLGGTVNDVVLATVVGAVRLFLIRRGNPPEGLNYRAMIPVSIRSHGERGTLGNRVAQMVTELCLDESNPRRRYQRVVEATQAVKHSHQVEVTELIGGAIAPRSSRQGALECAGEASAFGAAKQRLGSWGVRLVLRGRSPAPPAGKASSSYEPDARRLTGA
jgi:hypothetical protein